MNGVSAQHKDWLHEQLGFCLSTGEVNALLDALASASPVSIRVNTCKFSGAVNQKHVPWCNSGYYLTERPSFTHDPFFHTGAYYVQEASSMFVDFVIREFMREHTSGKINVLDACAAPGGKTTLLSTAVGDKGIVVANEVIGKRFSVLEENILKNGNANMIPCKLHVDKFASAPGYFHFILADVPCSGEGLWRKDPDAVNEWSPAAVDICVERQRNILDALWPALQPGGWLVYSTCTYNKKENEENIAWALNRFEDAEIIELKTNDDWGIVQTSYGDVRGYRFFPHRLMGEGFFCCVLRKKEKDSHCKTGKSLSGWKRVEAPNLHLDKPERVFLQNKEGITAACSENVFTVLHELSHLALSLHPFYCQEEKHGKTRWLPPLAWRMDCRAAEVPDLSFAPDKLLSYLMCDTSAFRVSDLEGHDLVRVVCHQTGLGFLRRAGQTIRIDYPREYRILRPGRPFFILD